MLVIPSRKLSLEIALLFCKLHGKNIEANNTQSFNFQTVKDYNKLIKSCNASQLVKELLTKADQFLSLHKRGNKGYDEAVLKKAAALRTKVTFDTNMNERIKSLHEAEILTKPYSETMKGFWVYIQCLIQLDMCYRTSFQFGKALEYLKMADKLYKNFDAKKPNVVDIWIIDNILLGEYKKEKHTVEDYKFTFYQIANGFMTHYQIVNNEEGQLEYACPFLHYLERTNSLPARQFGNFQMMVSVIKLFQKKQMLKMTAQCLAGLHFMLQKYRRSLPRAGREKINLIESEVALLFAGWGSQIVSMSMRRLRNMSNPPINNEFYEEIPMFQISGAKKYAHEFPIELVNTYDEVEPLLKRAKDWLLKSNELSGERVPGVSRTALAYMFIALDYEIKYYKGQ